MSESESEPIFTDDDSVEQEIEANEARDLHPKEPALERTLDKMLSPITDRLASDELTPEEAEAVRRQNDRNRESE